MKQCTHCKRLTGYRTCPWCGKQTLPIDNRRARDKKKKRKA